MHAEGVRNKQHKQYDNEFAVHQTARITKKRTIFQVDEGHRSRCTAYKYKIDFEHFLNYIKICDQEGLLDLGKEAIQEVVIKYVKYLRDDPKKHSRSTINCRISAILYFLDNDIELNKRKIKRYFSRSTAIHGRIVASG